MPLHTAKTISIALWTFVSAVTAMAATEGPSFPCDKAQTRIEKAICANAELSRLDEWLERFYQGGRQRVGDGAKCLQDDQKQWLKKTRNACADDACLKQAYLDRLAALRALQPGINEIREFALPNRASLVWIIPPVEDSASRLAAKPFQVTGPLRYDNSIGGFVIQSGKAYALVLDMFVDGATAGELSALKGKSFSATGHLAKDESGQAFFDERYCVFVYRTP